MRYGWDRSMSALPPFSAGVSSPCAGRRPAATCRAPIVQSKAPADLRPRITASRNTRQVHGSTGSARKCAARFRRDSSLSGSWQLMSRSTFATAENAASIAMAASGAPPTRTETMVPTSGLARSMPQYNLVEHEQAAHAVGEVLARQGCAADVANVGAQAHRVGRGFPRELRAPSDLAHLAAVGLAVVEHLHYLDLSISAEPE